MQKRMNNEAKPITIYDIAREAGVSASTVSRALRNSGGVSEDKKQRIMEVARKYNFKPSALARGLADSRSKCIGIIVADIRNPYYAELYASCEKAAQDAGYTLMIFNQVNWNREDKEGRAEAQIQLLEKMLSMKMEAVIVVDGMAADLISDVVYVEAVNRIMASIPVVITGKLDGTRCRIVRIDHMTSVDLLMEHLLSLGHRRIAMVGGQPDVFSTYEKQLRYKQILRANGIPFDPDLISEDGDYEEADGYRLMNRMFEKGVSMTAVIAVNDPAATGVVRSILEHGYRIPQDISVVSYDNTYISRMMIPRLTSVDYNYDLMGKTLIETAVSTIEGKSGDILQVVEPVLVCGESSGRAPGSPAGE